MKKIFLLVTTFQTLAICTFGQVLFSNSCGNLTLQSYTTTSANTQYTAVPGIFSLISDGRPNNVGLAANPNRPFNVPAFKNNGWSVVYNQAENDTFLVSTSWLDTTGIAVDRWIITPPVSNISANTVLTWLAKSPDASFRDGYEVYGTASQGALTPASFAIGDRLFALGDASSSTGEGTSWIRRSVNLGAFAAAAQPLRFAFRNNSKDMYQLWIDDIEVLTLPLSTDASASFIAADKYVLTNSSNIITLVVNNPGAADISTLTVKYSINNSSVNTEVFTYTPGISYKQGVSINFALPYTISSPGNYRIKSWIASVNNVADQNHLNDTAYYNVTVQASTPARTVLMEQFVSANDGESTDAQDKTNALQSAPVIIVNVHSQDSLMAQGSGALISDYKQNPATAMVDRFYFSDLGTTTITRPDYGPRFNTRLAKLSPASVTIINKVYNAGTRALSFTVKADFVGDVKGDYRMNAYLTENNICGPYNDTTINGYNQLNNYHNIPWSAYYQMGYYAPLANTYVIDHKNFKHQNTLIHSFDGAYGLPGSIPSTGGTQNQSYQQTFTLTLATPPANVHKFNPDNIYIVGFVAEYDADKNHRTVLNAVKQKLNSNAEFVGIAENTGELSLSVYPNPSATGIFYLNTSENNNYELKVFDLLGKCLKAESGSKPGMLDLSALPAGIYILNFKSGKNVLTEKIVIQKN